MGVLDAMTRIGDAVAGVNPLARLHAQGQVDEIQARTDASLQLARDRRIAAEQAQMERDAIERIQAAGPGAFTDPTQLPIGDLIAGKRGGDFSNVMEGRNRLQTYGEHETVATPAPIGDVAAEAARNAAMDSLAPGSAIALRRPPTQQRPGAPVIVEGDDGSPVYTTPAEAPGKHPAARPVAPRAPASPGPTSQQRNIDDLIARGVPENDAINIVMRTGDPRAAYVRILNTLTNQKDAAFRPIYSPEAAAGAATQAVEAIYGAGSLERAATGPVQPPAPPAPQGGDRPSLDSFFK